MMPHEPAACSKDNHHGGHHPPETEVKSARHRLPHFFHEKRAEPVPSENKKQHSHHQHRQQIPSPLQDHRSENPVICRHFLVAVPGFRMFRRTSRADDTATDELPYPREDEIGYISYIHGVKGRQPRCGRVYRQENLSPSQAPEPECNHAHNHGHGHEFPSAACQSADEIAPFHSLERKIQEHGCNCK